MEDQEILELYWMRSEAAIRKTEQKYGRYCMGIAYRILDNREDSAECVNDAYLKAWEHIPPERPSQLKLYLGRIVRNLALNRYKYQRTHKRGGAQVELALEELREGMGADSRAPDVADQLILAETLNRFLGSLSPENRRIFLRRYWYFSSIREIAEDYGFTESKVKMSLQRSRKALRDCLEREDRDD